MAVIVPATLAQFGDLTDEAIQNVYVMRAQTKRNMEGFFNVSDTNSYYDKDSYTLGTERAKFIADNASVVYDAPIQGYDKTLFAKICQVFAGTRSLKYV